MSQVDSWAQSHSFPTLPRRPGRRIGNYFKTAMLLAALTSLFLWVGERMGGANGLLFAGIFVAAMNFGSYWWSDKIALALHGARPIPEEELPWLHQMVRDLSARAGLPLPKLYLIPAATPNAFATGRNPQHAAVAVTAGILDLLDRRELQGVLAHELSHVVNRDTLISTVAATLAGIISQAARMIFWFGGAFLSGRDGDRDRDHGGLEQLGLLLVAPIVAMILQLAVSRSREYAADASGAQLLGDGTPLADALLKLERGVQYHPYDRAPATAHLFIVNPFSAKKVLALFSTHPPIEERIARLRAMPRGF